MTKTDDKVAKTPSSDTMRTTASMKRKANVVARCLINIMKVFRLCRKTRKKQGTA